MKIRMRAKMSFNWCTVNTVFKNCGTISKTVKNMAFMLQFLFS